MLCFVEDGLIAERPYRLLTCTAPAVRRRCRCREGQGVRPKAGLSRYLWVISLPSLASGESQHGSNALTPCTSLTTVSFGG